MSIRKGDTVQVIAGKDKGKQGEVLRVNPTTDRVVVRGINLVKRHMRASQQNPQGGIITKEAGIHRSNVMLVDPSDQKPCRVGTVREGAKLWRVSRRTGTRF